MKTSLYTPYGAFEMKATYQRNLLTANVTVTAAVLLMLLLAALYPKPVVIDDGPEEETPRDTTRIWIKPPPIVVPDGGGAGGVRPLPQDVVGGIPTPAPDEEFLDTESPLIASQSELSDLGLPTIDGDGEPGIGGGNGGGFAIDTGAGFWPDPTDFIAVEIPPEMIKQYQGEYPRVIREMGLSGKVLVRALIGEEGHVLAAELARSSGVEALDEVAVKWAKQCLFSPAIQNGRPVKIWVHFTYEFVLD